MNVKQFLSIKKPKARDFAALKVGGNDQYSNLGYAALKNRMKPGDTAKVEDALEVHADRSRVYRWILRGVSVDLAIRKVKTDLEVAARVECARQEREGFDDDEDDKNDEIIVGEFTLIRPHANKVLITKDGEILAEREINNDRHFDNFLAKFRQDGAYRESLTGGA